MDLRTKTVLRRGSGVLLAVGLLSSICVYFGHYWFHYQLLPALRVSPPLGDSVGGFIIIVAAYIGQRIVSLALFQDTELGSTVIAKRLEQDNHGLKQEVSKLDRLASTDKLTGAWNRRRLEEALPSEMDRLARYDHPLSLLILDIDFFKKVNDHFGHDAGDRVLVELASQLQSALRTSDSLTRLGGEEFVVLCPNSTLSTTSMLAGRLRERIAKANFSDVGHITVSIGVAECLPEETWERWFQRADAALYQAKANGRNQVQYAPEIPPRDGIGENVSPRFLQLIWRKAYESGHDGIDREHQALFDHANNLLAAMFSGRPRAEAGEMIDAFIHDVARHFQHEEAIFLAAAYPRAGAHADIHRELNARAVMLAEQFRNGVLEAGELFQFLAYDVVTKHILGADREFFPYLKRPVDSTAVFGGSGRLDSHRVGIS